MVRMTIDYVGGLRCRAVHGPSKTELATDAPTDNRGRGESFSPTDLVATALATCLLTTMAMRAEDAGLSLDGATATVEKIMSAEPPRRIARLVVDVQLPLPRSADPEGRLEHAGRNCPVALSLAAELEQVITFRWKDEG
ncbi:MAG: OsmC family peroxiredoxin [Verrucomicrobia bacterium]|nr:MAG: OsmC family peroxiredoxin [Verrucomicrobiota bacterium]